MRQILPFILPFVFASYCFGQTHKTEHESPSLKDTVDRTIIVGWQEIYDRLPILEFEDISKANFLEYKRQFKNKIKNDLSKIILADTTFSIHTSKAILNYNRQFSDNKYIDRRDFSWVEYKGYINSLKLYVLEGWVNGEFTLGSLFMVDSVSNIEYAIISDTDGPATPVLSPNSQFLATYASIDMEENVGILKIIKVTKIKGVVTYKEFASAELKQLLITDLVWINDISFALKVNRKTYNEESKKWEDNFSYVKTLLPIKKKA